MSQDSTLVADYKTIKFYFPLENYKNLFGHAPNDDLLSNDYPWFQELINFIIQSNCSSKKIKWENTANSNQSEIRIDNFESIINQIEIRIDELLECIINL